MQPADVQRTQVPGVQPVSQPEAESRSTPLKLVGWNWSESTYCFGKDTHELRELMCEHGQHGSERAKACCEEDEEGKLFLWVHGHLMERWSSSQKRRTSYKQGG